ncbi:MAG: hypothetical protein AAF385_17455 [Pseudomonadota bacterium]
MNLSDKTDWNKEQIESFLFATRVPVRIAVMDQGYPLICSVWFEYEQGNIVCVSHKDSKLAQLLEREKRCGFEIAPNDPPYMGIRGKADVSVSQSNVETRLNRLIERYLGNSNPSLANWLLSRVEHEYEFRLTPVWITSWDYSDRMDEPR